MDPQLQIFITVAEKKNFSRAAEELHMTQPAVSQYIRQFEDQIGARLLERTNKYVRLNKAGEIVYHHAKEIVALYAKMQRLIDDLTDKVSGPVTIGASYTFGEYVLPHILSTLKSDYPGTRPSVTIGNTKTIAELIATHQIDIGIIEGKYDDSRLIKEDFAEDEMVVVASPAHPLTKRKDGIFPHELARELWLVREQGSGTREAMDLFFTEADIAPAELMKFSSTQPIKEAVIANLGISFLSNWAIQRELKYGELCVLPVIGLPFRRHFSMVTNTPFQTKTLDVFMDLLRRKLDDPLN